MTCVGQYSVQHYDVQNDKMKFPLLN